MSEYKPTQEELAARERYRKLREADPEDFLPEEQIQALIRKADEATARERAKPAVVAV